MVNYRLGLGTYCGLLVSLTQSHMSRYIFICLFPSTLCSTRIVCNINSGEANNNNNNNSLQLNHDQTALPLLMIVSSFVAIMSRIGNYELFTVTC